MGIQDCDCDAPKTVYYACMVLQIAMSVHDILVYILMMGTADGTTCISHSRKIRRLYNNTSWDNTGNAINTNDPVEI